MRAHRYTFITYIGFAASLVFLFFGGIGCSNGGTTNDMRKGLPDTLNVAMELSPMGMIMEEDTLTGYSYEILKNICQNNGIVFNPITYTSLESAIEDAKNNKIDIFIFNTPVTALIRNFFITTEPLYLDRQVLIQNKTISPDSLIKTHQDLEGAKIYVARNFALTDRINHLSNELGASIEVVELDSITERELINKINTGELQLGAIARSSIIPLLKDYPDLDISVELSLNQFRAWMLNPSDTVLRDSLNTWISKFKETDDFKKLSVRYHLD